MESTSKQKKDTERASYLIVAELVITDHLCIITGNAETREYRDASPEEARRMEKMMNILQEELEKPLIDGGWKAATEKMVTATSRGPGKGGAMGVETMRAFSVPFYNPGDRPVMVKMIVHIRSSPDTTARILKKIDWQKIEGALTS